MLHIIIVLFYSQNEMPVSRAGSYGPSMKMAQICKCPKSGLIFDFTYKKYKHNMSDKCKLCYELFADHEHRLNLHLLQI